MAGRRMRASVPKDASRSRDPNRCEMRADDGDALHGFGAEGVHGLGVAFWQRLGSEGRTICGCVLLVFVFACVNLFLVTVVTQKKISMMAEGDGGLAAPDARQLPVQTVDHVVTPDAAVHRASISLDDGVGHDARVVFSAPVDLERSRVSVRDDEVSSEDSRSGNAVPRSQMHALVHEVQSLLDEMR